jgi:hypothetical protein
MNEQQYASRSEERSDDLAGEGAGPHGRPMRILPIGQ